VPRTPTGLLANAPVQQVYGKALHRTALTEAWPMAWPRYPASWAGDLGPICRQAGPTRVDFPPRARRVCLLA
jgi:hypothetical protein